MSMIALKRIRMLLAALLAVPATLPAANTALLGWNNLGMHCMDSDYSVFSILPPYTVIQAQLIVNGLLVTNGAGYTVTYQAFADPSGSINSTSVGKSDFWAYTPFLYGPLAPDTGLLGWAMPGASNAPQSMLFENTNSPAAGVFTPVNWWRAEGIPMTAHDDSGKRNTYSMLRLIAWNAADQPVATNDIVTPVSDEMDCRACHASGGETAAEPQAGWVWTANPERDYRLNILRLHDEHQFAQQPAVYAAALAARGFDPAGLYRDVTADGKAVLCAACHADNALGAAGFSNIPPFTVAMHSFHAHVLDPVLNVPLDEAANRSACYRCHPGATTQCLRGAMGKAVGPDGAPEIQCQSCHGNLSAVGSTSRAGWLTEPLCQSCHTGTATHNNGQLVYTSAFETNGQRRVAVDSTFASTPDTPAPGLAMFRFSVGHGGLQCEACHGSTHAIFPTTQRNDNIRDIELQGHAGMMVECTACHVTMSANSTNLNLGPHGMHPITQDWVDNHHDLIQGNIVQCQACHGTDYRGTVLSRAQNQRTWNAFGGTISFNRGDTIGCYTCHLGPGEGDPNPSTPPAVANVSTNTTNDKAVALTLPATGSGLTFRIISEPANGTVGLSNNVATYFPNPGFVGTDNFGFAAYDGAKNSNLAAGMVAVAQGPYSIGVTANAPTSWPSSWPVAFAAVPVVTNNAGPVTFEWNFGDGSAPSTNQYAAHAFAAPGNYAWSVTATVAGKTATASGTITVTRPEQLSLMSAAQGLSLAWPSTAADTIVEESETLGPNAHWVWVTNAVQAGGVSTINLPVPANGQGFFRVRQPQ